MRTSAKMTLAAVGLLVACSDSSTDPAVDITQDVITDVDPSGDTAPEPDAMPEPDMVPEPDALPDVVPEPDALPDVVPEPDALPDVVPEPDALPDMVPEPDVLPEPDTLPDVLPEPDVLPDLDGGGEVWDGGSTVGQTLIQGLTQDPYLFPIEGVHVWIDDGSEGVAVSNHLGHFTLHTDQVGEVVVHYDGSDAGPRHGYASHHRALDLDAFTDQGAVPVATITLKPVGGVDRPITEASGPSVGFGGLTVVPTVLPLVKADGTEWAGQVEMSLTPVNLLSIYSFFFAPDVHRAETSDGTPLRLKPLALFEVVARGLSPDGEVGEVVHVPEDGAMTVSWDLEMGLQVGDLCGGGTAWEYLPIWRLDEATATWKEVAPETTYGPGPPSGIPVGMAAARYEQGSCHVTAILPGDFGWWAIGDRDAEQGCITGLVTNAQGAGYPGTRVDAWDESGGGAGHVVTGADGTYCIQTGSAALVTLQARRFEGAGELSTSFTLESVGGGAGGSCAQPETCAQAYKLDIYPSCVSGLVLDAQEQPVAGATVFTSAGTQTITDAAGHYCVPAPGMRDFLVMATDDAGTAYKRQAVAFLFEGSCAESDCLAIPEMTPVECDHHDDCADLAPEAGGFEDVAALCDREWGVCQLRMVDESAISERFARAYRAAAVYHRQTDRRDAAGELTGCQFPLTQGVTPVEGTCCSTNGLAGPDSDHNDRCDADPSVWSTDTWSNLYTSIAGQFRTLLTFESSAETFSVHASSDSDCNGVEHMLTATGVAGQNCDVPAPDTVALTTGSSADAPLSLTVSFTQKLTFSYTPSITSLHPAAGEIDTHLGAIITAATDYFHTHCSFPPNTPTTPIEGTCCSENGLGGPDTNWNNRCDPDPSAWTYAGWEALELVPTNEHTMIYSFESYPVGDALQLEATAHGDLDCDGVQSTFRRFLFADPSSCLAEPLDGLYTEREAE